MREEYEQSQNYYLGVRSSHKGISQTTNFVVKLMLASGTPVESVKGSTVTNVLVLLVTIRLHIMFQVNN